MSTHVSPLDFTQLVSNHFNDGGLQGTATFRQVKPCHDGGFCDGACPLVASIGKGVALTVTGVPLSLRWCIPQSQHHSQGRSKTLSSLPSPHSLFAPLHSNNEVQIIAFSANVLAVPSFRVNHLTLVNGSHKE